MVLDPPHLGLMILFGRAPTFWLIQEPEFNSCLSWQDGGPPGWQFMVQSGWGSVGLVQVTVDRCCAWACSHYCCGCCGCLCCCRAGFRSSKSTYFRHWDNFCLVWTFPNWDFKSLIHASLHHFLYTLKSTLKGWGFFCFLLDILSCFPWPSFFLFFPKLAFTYPSVSFKKNSLFGKTTFSHPHSQLYTATLISQHNQSYAVWRSCQQCQNCGGYSVVKHKRTTTKLSLW